MDPLRSNTVSMFLRISPDDVVIYGNAAMAAYLRVAKEDLPGTPLDVIQSRLRGEISEAFGRPGTSKRANQLVTDADGRVFELKAYSEGGVLDLILDEVTEPKRVLESYAPGLSVQSDQLSEEEIRSIWHPEHRQLSIVETRLCGVEEASSRLSPVEVRLMLNVFAEECSESILCAGGSLGDQGTESVQGIFGGPRYYRDHGLRGIKSLFDQLERMSSLRSGFSVAGKEIPPLSAAIASGESLFSSLNTKTGNRFSAAGPAPSLASKLARLARPGEILVAESSLQEILRNLPEDWESVVAEREESPDLSDVEWPGDEVQPLPEDRARTVYLLGPNVSSNTQFVEVYLDYLYAVKCRGFDKPVHILRAVRPEFAGGSIEVSEDNIVSGAAVQNLGKYKLLQVVGEGGMGRVWKGQDRFGNFVAIKVLSAADGASDAQIKRFQREAEIMARLPHRNICRVYEISEFEGIQFIAMEFVDGLTLSDLLYTGIEEKSTTSPRSPDLSELIQNIRSSRASATREGDESSQPAPSARPLHSRILPVEQSLALFAKVCEAVQFAHEHGVLHRDLKPGNVLLREDGEPLVADFGLAKSFHEDSGISLSISGHVVGTMENMAPEQAESSKDVDERADVFSLGTILYQMATGRRYFEATGNLVADAQALQTHEPVRPRAYNPSIDPDLELIILKALRANPAERYRSVAALRADLEHFRRGEVITAKAVSALDLARKLIQRNRRVAAVIAGSLFLFAIGTVWAFFQIDGKRRLAEEALLSAEQHASAAERAFLIAQERTQAAETALADREQALREMKFAQKQAEDAAKEAEHATHLRKQALEETEAEREQRLRLESQIQDREEELRKLASKKEAQENREPESDASDSPSDPLAERLAKQSRDHWEIARSLYQLGLTNSELMTNRRTPEIIEERLLKVSDHLLRAMAHSQPSKPMWMLKGRLHLLNQEYDDARHCFEEAKNSFDQEIHARNQDPPQMMLDLLQELERAPRSKTALAEALRKIPSPENFRLEELLRFSLTQERNAGRPINANLHATLGAALFEIVSISAEPPPMVEIETNSSQTTLFIHQAQGLHSVQPLVGQPLDALVIDQWPNIHLGDLSQIKVTKLVLSQGRVTAHQIPLHSQFPHLKEVSLRHTMISSIQFLQGSRQLEVLDLEGSSVTDLRPIREMRHLRELSLPDLPLDDISPLRQLLQRLERLTIGPLLASQAEVLEPLKTHPRLQYLRVYGDPHDQTTVEFWQRLAEGLYHSPESSEVAD